MWADSKSWNIIKIKCCMLEDWITRRPLPWWTFIKVCEPWNHSSSLIRQRNFSLIPPFISKYSYITFTWFKLPYLWTKAMLFKCKLALSNKKNADCRLSHKNERLWNDSRIIITTFNVFLNRETNRPGNGNMAALQRRPAVINGERRRLLLRLQGRDHQQLLA